MGKIKDISGLRFGKLHVVKMLEHNKYHKVVWECKCDCGNIKEVVTSQLTSLKTKSCGCLRGAKPTHGMKKAPEYRIWQAMKTRCLNPNAINYKHYGGRGITICDRWLHSFNNFYADMGPRPSPKHSVDRKKNDKGYLPENCHWATQKEQCRNKRNTKKYKDIVTGQLFGSLQELSEKLGIERAKLYYQLQHGKIKNIIQLKSWNKKKKPQ
jgi:hypothetical protein